VIGGSSVVTSGRGALAIGFLGMFLGGEVSLYVAQTAEASERAARETLALPVYSELTAEQRHFVVGSIRQFFSGKVRGNR
jgi:hypothetical protein